MKTKSIVAAAALLVVSPASALAQEVIWNDDFESYTDQAALDARYTQIYPPYPMLLDPAKGCNSYQSIHAGMMSVGSQARMYFNLPGGLRNGTDDLPLKVEFMVDTDVDDWSTRQYVELRSYSGSAYGVGSLVELLALGFTSSGSGVDTTLINQRILYGPHAGWGNLTDVHATRATIAAEGNDWTKLGMVIKSSTVEYYVNDNLDSVKSINPGTWFDCVVIGSGLNSAADVWFDNLVVTVPEPSAFALGLVGGLGLLCVLRRRAA